MDPREYFSNIHRCLERLEVQEAGSLSLDEKRGFSLAIDWIEQIKKKRAKVILIGNGGSAAVASHHAVDLWRNGGVRAIAFNDAALLTCISNDYSFPEVFEKPVAMFADPADLLIAISSSGQSPNILKAVEKAKAIGCRVITMSGFKPDNPLRKAGHLNFYIPSESYGAVEIAHLALCHYVIDHLVARAAAVSE